MAWMDIGWRICLFDVFLDGLGWVHGFLMIPEWNLMVLVCMWGWFFGWLFDGVGRILDERWMDL